MYINELDTLLLVNTQPLKSFRMIRIHETLISSDNTKEIYVKKDPMSSKSGRKT